MQKYTEYQAALQKVPQVGSLPDPELNMGVFLSPMELVSGNQVADLRLMQMFPWFGTLRAAKDEMSLMANAKYELFRDAKLQVFYEVQSTWFDLYKIQQNIRISEKNIEILKTIERIALVKFRTAPSGNGGSSSSGSSRSYRCSIRCNLRLHREWAAAWEAMQETMPPLPQIKCHRPIQWVHLPVVLHWPIFTAYKLKSGDLENNIALLKNQQNTLVAQFNSYLNRPATSPVSLPDTLIADSLGIPLLAVSDSMLANNPMLGMLQYEQQSLDSRKKMVTKMGYPMIGLGVNYSVINKNEMSTSAMNGKDMIMPMVTLTLPIYRRKYKAMQTEADLLKDCHSTKLYSIGQ